jgi:cell division protein FtsB
MATTFLATRTAAAADCAGQQRIRSMAVGRELKRRVKAAIAPSVFLALVAYFGWNAMQGDRGLKAYAARAQDLVVAQSQLAQAQAEQAAWERRVAALRTNRLDVDALDERARAVLNLADPNDIVVPYGPGGKLY